MHTTSINDPVFLRNRHLLSPELATAWLEDIYPKIRSNWQWFRRTQRGEIKQWDRQARNSKEAYRWRGRTPNHTLTSGLDDYPRANPPHVGELHVDLISWMGFSTRLLRSIAERLVGEDYEDDVAEYEQVEKHILWNLEDLHWNDERQSFCDLSVGENDESVFLCHNGYLTLFPFLLGLLPADSPKLGALLDMVYDPEELWSPYGLRSLSKSDEFFYTGEVYWRGPVWANINYMALASLHKNYMTPPGPYREKARKIYTELRENIVSNIYEQYKRTGYVWEQYDALTGEGRRSHPFTGWTSLVLLIMAEKY
jgi:mannosyl-oligosaccharide glucosidase